MLLQSAKVQGDFIVQIQQTPPPPVPTTTATVAVLKPSLPFEPETVMVPAGPFWMGSEPGPNVATHETPRHQLTLPAYRIGKYPVTNRQYGELVRRERNCEVPKGWSLREPPAAKLDHPVVNVSWQAARAYCDWLSRESDRHYRLPTEAEWEKAARGPDGRCYPWGNVWDDQCCQHSAEETAPVMAHDSGVSGYDVCDMLGNVQEWTSTLWGSEPAQPAFGYPYQRDDDREDPMAEQRLYQTYRIHRGGSYRDELAGLRCSARGFAPPDSKVGWRGFRVLMEDAATTPVAGELQRTRQELARLQQQ
jgi:formylglycine-generating enzyme required for sulfatase activity